MEIAELLAAFIVGGIVFWNLNNATRVERYRRKNEWTPMNIRRNKLARILKI
jgi:hypothetical protein